MIIVKSEPALKIREYSNITFIANVYCNKLILLEPDERNNFPFPFCIFQYVTLGNKSLVTPTHYTITGKNNQFEVYKTPLDQKCGFDLYRFTTHCRWIHTSVFLAITLEQ